MCGENFAGVINCNYYLGEEEAAIEAEVGRLNSNDTDPYHWSLIRIIFFY